MVKYYNLFNWFFIAFNTAYGIICLFFMKPWCQYILFQTQETQEGILDKKPFQYLDYGCGGLCIGISAIAYLLNQENIPINIKKKYIWIQIINWAYWTCFELYFYIVKLTNPIIGVIQIILCFILFVIAILCHREISLIKENDESDSNNAI
jgi:hypothetical protein